MNECRNCKFWDVQPEDVRLFVERPSFKSCLKMAGDCLSPTYPPTLAMAYETGERESRVMTHEGFGCIMFEPKES